MPYVSKAQQGWAHTAAGEKALGGPAKVAEWDAASKGRKLPKRINRTAQTGGTSLPKKTPKHGAGHLMSFGSLAPGVEEGE